MGLTCCCHDSPPPQSLGALKMRCLSLLMYYAQRYPNHFLTVELIASRN